jgi:hypothetical protein
LSPEFRRSNLPASPKIKVLTVEVVQDRGLLTSSLDHTG